MGYFGLVVELGRFLSCRRLVLLFCDLFDFDYFYDLLMVLVLDYALIYFSGDIYRLEGSRFCDSSYVVVA